jgi:hypothetical protein
VTGDFPWRHINPQREMAIAPRRKVVNDAPKKSSRQLEGVAGWFAAMQCHRSHQRHLPRI